MNVCLPPLDSPTSLAYGLSQLPFAGRTRDVAPTERVDYWRGVFSRVWGPVDVVEVGGNLSGSLQSHRTAELTFNRITLGNQLFECLYDNSARNEPFFSLTFPQSGSAECIVGDSRVRLIPDHAYLIKVETAAKLCVENQYSTINIQIPISQLEYRLGRQEKIIPCSIVKAEPVYHLMLDLIRHITRNSDELDGPTTSFLTRQLLDTVAFFLSCGANMSEDTLAVRAVRARALAWIDKNFRVQPLNPFMIAQACGISRSYLYKVFGDGPSVMDHLRHRRLEAARNMIDGHGKRSLTTVAMDCGFSSSSEFSRLFKKEYGCTPSEIEGTGLAHTSQPMSKNQGVDGFTIDRATDHKHLYAN